MRLNDAFDAKIVNTRLTKIFIANFAHHHLTVFDINLSHIFCGCILSWWQVPIALTLSHIYRMISCDVVANMIDILFEFCTVIHCLLQRCNVKMFTCCAAAVAAMVAIKR